MGLALSLSAYGMARALEVWYSTHMDSIQHSVACHGASAASVCVVLMCTPCHWLWLGTLWAPLSQKHDL
jgi:hypothetical protein